MGRPTSNKRPWLAALLSAFVTGLGHLYLRRWRRAIGWLVAVVGAGVLFVDPSVMESLVAGDVIELRAVAPIFLVGSLSVFDAYLLAHTQNGTSRVQTDANGQYTHCPNCGKELEPDLDFCHWCTAEVRQFDRASTDVSEERDESR